MVAFGKKMFLLLVCSLSTFPLRLHRTALFKQLSKFFTKIVYMTVQRIKLGPDTICRAAGAGPDSTSMFQ